MGCFSDVSWYTTYSDKSLSWILLMQFQIYVFKRSIKILFRNVKPKRFAIPFSKLKTVPKKCFLLWKKNQSTKQPRLKNGKKKPLRRNRYLICKLISPSRWNHFISRNKPSRTLIKTGRRNEMKKEFKGNKKGKKE